MIPLVPAPARQKLPHTCILPSPVPSIAVDGKAKVGIDQNGVNREGDCVMIRGLLSL